jgi:hypothetical protein
MLTAVQERMHNQMTTLIEQVAALMRVVHTLTVDVGTLNGKSLEAEYRSRGPCVFEPGCAPATCLDRRRTHDHHRRRL